MLMGRLRGQVRSESSQSQQPPTEHTANTQIPTSLEIQSAYLDGFSAGQKATQALSSAKGSGNDTKPLPNLGSNKDRLEQILNDIENYCVQSALGGTPFKTEEENLSNNEKTYVEGRDKAKQAIQELLTQAYNQGYNDGKQE